MQNKEEVVRYWPPTNSFFLLGVLTSVPILVKIDQEMRPWECLQTDTLTEWQTYRRKPILKSAIAMAQIISEKRRFWCPCMPMPMPILAACHLIYICSIIALYCYSCCCE